jgi:ABC-type Zn uptake system ZnuABC Zn-binding protein ZnuA
LSLLSAKSTPADTSEATPEKSVQTAESEVITYEGQSTEDTNEPVEAQPDESNDLIESSDGSNDVDNLDEPVTTGSATAILP